MPIPRPHQLTGAKFLAERRTALLADEQRVGKTGAAIIAADYVFAINVLVVTTASARAQWGREFHDWQKLTRTVYVIDQAHTELPAADVVIVGWSMIADARLKAVLRSRQWDLLILDESHYAKNISAARTRATYAVDGLAHAADRIWCLTGTPVPNAPDDLYPMLRTLAPDRLGEFDTYETFLKRYCVVQPNWIGGRWVDVIKGGKNLGELQERLHGFYLRRRQADIGIAPPFYSIVSLPCGIQHGDLSFDEETILRAAEEGNTRDLDMHLGVLRRLTATTKARAAANLVKDEFEGGLDRIVLMAWHTDAIAILARELGDFGVSVIQGSTSPAQRDQALTDFQNGHTRVFIGQIQAAGEAVDLSISKELLFVEPSFVPKDMSQAALRITNMNRHRQCFVRLAALAGSIDEPVMEILARKVATINHLLGRGEEHASSN